MYSWCGLSNYSGAMDRVLRVQRAPLLAAAAGGAALLVLHLRDPHVSGAYGFCPFHALTGLWCPGCGGLRAVHDLTYGDLTGALRENALVPPLLVVAVLGWAMWLVRGRPPRGLSTRGTVVAVVVLVVFGVLRNTAVGRWLAPG